MKKTLIMLLLTIGIFTGCETENPNEIYTVKKNDTFSKIYQKTSKDISYKEFRKLNSHIKNPNNIKPGDSIYTAGSTNKNLINLNTDEIKNADVIFQTSRSNQSKYIQALTQSPYSHVAIIAKKGDKYTVIEASSTVREIPLETWIQNGINGEYAIFRYNMNESDSKKVVENARKFLGIPYDVQFHPSDNKMYCSELVYKAFDRALGVKIGKEENISKFIEKASKVKSQKLEKMISSRFRGKLPNHNLVTPVSQTDYLKRIKTTYDGKNE